MKPVSTEKAVMMMEKANTIVFEVERQRRKQELKKEIETLFDVQVANINTLIRHNKKYAYRERHFPFKAEVDSQDFLRNKQPKRKHPKHKRQKPSKY